MNKARVPFIVSIDVISLGLFLHRLLRLVMAKNEGSSLKHTEECSVREETPSRCGGPRAGGPPLSEKVSIDEIPQEERPRVREQWEWRSTWSQHWQEMLAGLSVRGPQS